MPDPLQICVTMLLGSSVTLLIWSLFRFPVAVEPPLHRRLALAVGTGQRQTLFEQKALAPLMNLALSLARRISFPAIRGLIFRHLNASGNPNSYSIDEYLALCLASAAGLAVGVTILLVTLASFDPLTVTMAALVGFAVPLWTLREAGQARILRISKKLPYTLDLISLMMEAGATFPEAIETLVRDDPHDDFNVELRIVRAEIDFGTTRAQALSNMAQRIPLDALRSVVGAVNQAEALGSPLAGILKSQSSMMRMHRSVRAEKLSASASLRILVPSMIILMAVVLIIFGPMIVRGIHGDFNSIFGSMGRR